MNESNWMELRNLIHTICNTYITAQQEKRNIAAVDLAIRIAPSVKSKKEWTMQEICELAETIAVFIATGRAPKT